MAKLTKASLEEVLRRQLHLGVTDHLHLENPAGRFNGSVVAKVFSGKGDRDRQAMIWDALEREFGAESVRMVGMLLAYTPEEWSAGEVAARAAKAG